MSDSAPSNNDYESAQISTERKAEIAVAVAKAIALELLKVIPVIGPYISVGTKATLDKLEKISDHGKEFSPLTVLEWLSSLPKGDYEQLILKAIDQINELPLQELDRAQVVTILVDSQPSLKRSVAELKLREAEESSALTRMQRLRAKLSEEKRSATVDEEYHLLQSYISLRDWSRALDSIRRINKRSPRNQLIDEIDQEVTQRHDWTALVVFATAVTTILLTFFGTYASLAIGISPDMVFAVLALSFFPIFLSLNWLLPRTTWRLRRQLRGLFFGEIALFCILVVVGEIQSYLAHLS